MESFTAQPSVSECSTLPSLSVASRPSGRHLSGSPCFLLARYLARPLVRLRTLAKPDCVRHAHALGLMAKRRRNVRSALERIIEKAGEVEASAAAVVSAVAAYAKINASGQWVDRSESINLNDLFERMTGEEMEAYAREAALPAWFKHAL